MSAFDAVDGSSTGTWVPRMGVVLMPHAAADAASTLLTDQFKQKRGP
jgi:hypothetical protein